MCSIRYFDEQSFFVVVVVVVIAQFTITSTILALLLEPISKAI
jgi:hypothetical protein